MENNVSIRGIIDSLCDVLQDVKGFEALTGATVTVDYDTEDHVWNVKLHYGEEGRVYWRDFESLKDLHDHIEILTCGAKIAAGKDL